MKILFSKYQSTGNDFVLINDMDNAFPQEDETLVAGLCHRRFGIGADGLILVQQHQDADFAMVYFNADGKLGSFCGNGARATVKFARQIGLITNVANFIAADGFHRAKVNDEYVQVSMNDTAKPVNTEFGLFLNTGSPHVVIQVENIEGIDVDGVGKKIRYDPIFSPGGTNVNFVKLGSQDIHLRTYERGVEAETLSCGTGVTACALAYHSIFKGSSPVKVFTQGGALEVSFEAEELSYRNIWLSGGSTFVFSGDLKL